MSIYTDGSKQDEKVACAVISPNFTDSIRLPDNSSIFTAEAKAIDIALYHIRDQPEKQFIIYSDSLSVLRGPGFDTRSGNILSFLLPLFQEGQLSVTGESMCTKYWLTA